MSTITKDLGAVTAYAYAKKKGYTGTEAEYAELMASYATVAQQASQSAQSAGQSATNASQSATDAETAQGMAQQAATYAQSAQASAQGFAQSAQQSAQSASQSASTASAAATSASTSAQTATTAASTATTKASKAAASEAAALSAKTDAETARDAAAQSASEAAASAESIDPDEFDRKIYAAYVTDIATGAIASFPDGANDIPMESVTVQIEPMQEGSGDPSPDNVRPITGWTGCEVQRTGKNLFNIQNVYPLFRVDGDVISKGASGHNIDLFTGTQGFGTVVPLDKIHLLPRLKAGTYNLSTQFITGSSAIHVRQVNDDGSLGVNIVINNGTGSFTLPSETYVTIRIETDQPVVFSNLQLEPGSTVTAYEPYGTTYNITFPTEAGTVYGGTLDVTTGVLTVTDAQIASYAGETLPGEWISDRDVYVAGTTPTTGAQVVYKLATPQTYTLTASEVTTLLGTNNIWADTGDTEVEYRADTKLYIQKKIAEAVSALS